MDNGVTDMLFSLGFSLRDYQKIPGL